MIKEKTNLRKREQIEERIFRKGILSIPRGSHGVDTFQRTSASRAEKPGAYSTPGTPSGRGVSRYNCNIVKSGVKHHKGCINSQPTRPSDET
jgi:hypothetical protein